MKWIKIVLSRLLICLKIKLPEKKMAKVTLEDSDGIFEFNLSELVYISYDHVSNKIVVVIQGKEPKYIPASDGNLFFLMMLAPYFRTKSNNDFKFAEELLSKSNAAKNRI